MNSTWLITLAWTPAQTPDADHLELFHYRLAAQHGTFQGLDGGCWRVSVVIEAPDLKDALAMATRVVSDAVGPGATVVASESIPSQERNSVHHA